MATTPIPGSLTLVWDDPNADKPECVGLPLIRKFNFSLGVPYQDSRQVWNIAWFAVAAPASVGMLAFFLANKSKFDRTRIRPLVVPVYAFVGLWWFFAADTLGKAIGFYRFPCAVAALVSLLVVPFVGLGMVFRQAFFLLLNRYAIASSTFTGGRLADVDDPMPTTFLARRAWEVKAVWDALIIVFRPLPSRPTHGAVAIASPSNDNAKDNNMPLEEQLQSLRTLKFVVTTRGQIMYAVAGTFPFLVSSAVVSAWGAKAFTLGCMWCPVGLNIVSYVIIAEGLLLVVVGSILAARTHGLRHRDPWGFLQEGRWAVADSAWTIFAFIVEIAPDWPDTPFDPSFFVLLGIVAVLYHATVHPILVAKRAQQALDAAVLPSTAKLAKLRRKARGVGASEGPVSSSGGGVTGVEDLVGSVMDSSNVASSSVEGKLDAVLADADLRAAFGEYLVTEFASENLDFVMQVREWRLFFADATPQTRLVRAKRISKLYIEHGAPLQVNVADSVVQAVRDALNSSAVPLEVFDAACRDVEYLLAHGSLCRWLQGFNA